MNIRGLFLLTILFIITYSDAYSKDNDLDHDSIPLRYVGEEIVIESFKQNSGLYIQSLSATLLSSSEIKEQNISSIKEFSAFIPNFFMPDYGSKMTSPAYIRGIGSRINSPSVALYVDGVPYFDRSSFDININDIERIEVLRGPQGTIYGRNTMGGVINIFTKSPFRNQGTNLSLSAGSHNTYETGISHYGRANDKVGYSLSTNYSHTGGYFKNSYTGKKADPMDAISTRARISWRIKPRLSAHLSLAYEYSDQDGYPYRLYDKKTGNIGEVNYNSPSFYRRNLSTNGLHVAYITDQFKLSSQSSFQFFNGTQGLDQDFTPVDRSYVDFHHRQQMYSQEFNIKSISEDSKYKWQFGVFGFHQNYFQTSHVDYKELNEHEIQDVKNPTKGFALYHQSTLDNILIQNLSLIFGLRYDWEKTNSLLIKSSYTGQNIPSQELPQQDKNSFSQITPKISVHYSYSRSGLIYLSAAKGYKTGGFNNSTEAKERIFDPEHSWSYELGTKSSLLDNLLHFDVSLFYIDWRDQQIAQNKSIGKGYILKNAGKTASKGVEISTEVRPTESLKLNVSYGYTHAKYKEYKRNEAISYDGNYLPMVPRNTLSVGANYTIHIDNTLFDRVVFNGQYVGIGKIYWNDKNDINQSFYNTLNGKVSFVRKNISLDLWVKNITEKEYISYYFETAGDYYVQKGKPFTCGLNINYKF